VIMLWAATGRATYLVLGLILFAAGALMGWAMFSHVQTRVDIWLHALDPSKVHEFGYGQVAQAQFGMATGGMVGSGLGQGSPDLIPFAATDFIFAAIGEELGLLGTTALLMLYFVLVARGFKIALSREDGFSKLLAMGLTSALAFQTFIIVGGVTRLIPLTGITLPFVSYGGSSLVSNFVLLALLVRVSSPPRARTTVPRGRPAPAASPAEPTVVTRRGGG
jgi:cell division protein FtsW (lipid II flippase)